MRRAGITAAGIAAATLGACGAQGVAWKATWSAPYADFDDRLREEFGQARALMQAGRQEAAHARLAQLVSAHPDNIELGAWLQEVELVLLERGVALLPDLAGEGASPEDALRRSYGERVEESPSVAGLVLAARVETDAIAAEIQLERALELDPRCAWAHYGRAHALLRLRHRVQRWREAREALRRTLEIDPGFVRARWLEAWMLAQEGAGRRAVFALDTWLLETRGDPRVTRDQRIAAELDLAQVRILVGDAKGARDLLLTLEGTTLGRTRRLAMLAVAEHELGDHQAALDAARRAEDSTDDTLLPQVQQALLLEHALGDAPGARAQWALVEEAAEGRTDLEAVLQGLRAQVERERAEHER